jgi:hypothetical protein
MAHHPMILSRFALMQVDLGDTRLINYIVEHNYRWYRGDPNHAAFWDPPFFYPAKNIAAYSDTLISVAPLYAMYRLAGLPPDTSFQLWMLTLSVLNYAVALHLLRVRVRLSLPASAAGAFLFAFASSRLNLMVQQPQLTHFLSLLTVDALFGLFPVRATSPARRGLLWLTASAGLVAQLSAAFYIAWFMIFSLGIALVIAMWLPSTRRELLDGLRRDLPWLVLCALLAAVAMRPWLVHHLAAAEALGPRSVQAASLLQPRPTAWLYTGPHNWLARWTMRLTGFPGFGASKHALPIGIGWVTSALALRGLLLQRTRASVRLLMLTGVVLFILVTTIPASLLVVVEHLLVLGPLALAYSRRTEEPWPFAAIVILILLFTTCNRHYIEHLTGFAVAALMITFVALERSKDDARGRLLLFGLVASLALCLIQHPLVLAISAGFGSALGALAYLLGWRSPRRIEAVALGGLLVFACLITFLMRPLVFGSSIALLLAIAAMRFVPTQPPPGVLINCAIIGLLLTTIFKTSYTAWYFCYIHVPGASALLFVGRVGLVMLIPAALGLGYFIDEFIARKRWALALGAALVCLVEQGVTTPSFDKYENRRLLSELAKRVDVTCEAFFYSPKRDRLPASKAHLDAMWAGLECGKPTLNGYSGHTPRGWRDFEECRWSDHKDVLRLRTALDEWKQSDGRSVGRVQWVDGPSPWAFP